MTGHLATVRNYSRLLKKSPLMVTWYFMCLETCSLLQQFAASHSHDHVIMIYDLPCFFPETSFWFLAQKKPSPLQAMNSFNCDIYLMTIAKNNIKSGWLLRCFNLRPSWAIMTYDGNSELCYGHKSRATCIFFRQQNMNNNISFACWFH